MDDDLKKKLDDFAGRIVKLELGAASVDRFDTGREQIATVMAELKAEQETLTGKAREVEEHFNSIHSKTTEAQREYVQATAEITVQREMLHSDREDHRTQNSNRTEESSKHALEILSLLEKARMDKQRLDDELRELDDEINGKKRDATGLLSAVMEEVERGRSDLKSKQSEIEQALRAGKAAAGKEGFDRQVSEFQELAAKNDAAGFRWLIAAGVVALVTLIVVVVMIFVPGVEGKIDAAAVAIIVSRFLLASFILYVTIWCGRQFSISQHLSTSNRHRATALATYEAFIVLAKNTETADSILLEATKYIFTHAQSGYLGKSEDTPVGQALNLVKTVAPKHE